MKHTFEESLKYFHDKDYEITIENDRFINFKSGACYYCDFYFDLELGTFTSNIGDESFEDVYHACNIVMRFVDDFIKRCDTIFPGYVKRIAVDYDS